MRLAILLTLGLVISTAAYGELVSFKMNVRVISFDQDTVECQFGDARGKFPRSAVVQKKFKSGDLVQINLEGEQISRALASVKPVSAPKSK